HSIVGGCTKIVQDVPPFTIVDGNPASVRGINQVGLQRRGFTDENIKALRTAYKKLFLKKDLNLSKVIESLSAELSEQASVAKLLAFIANSERGVIR
ncbi:MAG: acyl-[acyl-carrier-protein]--UDP-N-acetylglucosamine O-acyltransferase, partial [Verrucomicrobiaceae bacterium TMED86]